LLTYKLRPSSLPSISGAVVLCGAAKLAPSLGATDTIARNAYTDLFRRAARHTQLDENMPDTRISAQTQMEQSAEVSAVLAALQQLPEMDRTALLMRALDEMPYEEIAETLAIPMVTAKVKVHRARLKLMQTRKAWREVVPAAGAKP